MVGQWLWPEGLTARAEHIFWPATAVNLAGLLLLGWRYFPWIWTGAPVAIFLLGQPVKFSLIGATGNVLEALLAYWIIRRFGRFTGRFNDTRSVIALLLASLIAPFICSLTAPTYLVYDGTFTSREFWMAVGNWSLANGAAMLLLVPFLISLFRGEWRVRGQVIEAVIWGIALSIGAILTFGAVFEVRGLNFAFLSFPFVILVAVRFGPAETATALAVVMASIYLALSRHASVLLNEQVSEIIWFTQAFSWVLAATGMLVAALVFERRLAERRVANEQARILEVSLSEERARLAALRYQINPHFLFNALNSLRATFPLAAEVSREMVTELAGYLRSTLTRPDGDLARLHEEVDSIRHYLAIEQKRFGKDLVVEISIQPATEEILIPIFLLQPLVENAIRHGFMKSTRTLQLQISSRLEVDRLILKVANTGEWIEKTDRGRPGLGLENIRQRLRLLYGEKSTFALMANDGWVQAQIELPATQS